MQPARTQTSFQGLVGILISNINIAAGILFFLGLEICCHLSFRQGLSAFALIAEVVDSARGSSSGEDVDQ